MEGSGAKPCIMISSGLNKQAGHVISKDSYNNRRVEASPCRVYCYVLPVSDHRDSLRFNLTPDSFVFYIRIPSKCFICSGLSKILSVLSSLIRD
jgi:hypothetical protein